MYNRGPCAGEATLATAFKISTARRRISQLNLFIVFQLSNLKIENILGLKIIIFKFLKQMCLENDPFLFFLTWL
ncbi:MAG TPA: hypothetical protein VFM18_11595, partial [Methanosarcina sp.]|nr:hypothetical protein [Methanosarcina sp.]